MKFTKNFLIVLSLFTSLVGIAIIYFAAVNLEPQKIAITDLTADMEGRRISTVGYLTAKRGHENGHLFLTISDNKTRVEVPLFSDFMQSLNKIGITENYFHLNDKIAVRGTIQIYKGNLQIVPKSLDDVKILGE